MINSSRIGTKYIFPNGKRSKKWDASWLHNYFFKINIFQSWIWANLVGLTGYLVKMVCFFPFYRFLRRFCILCRSNVTTWLSFVNLRHVGLFLSTLNPFNKYLLSATRVYGAFGMYINLLNTATFWLCPYQSVTIPLKSKTDLITMFSFVVVLVGRPLLLWILNTPSISPSVLPVLPVFAINMFGFVRICDCFPNK